MSILTHRNFLGAVTAVGGLHSEWIDADGNSPMCESYDRRLAELISIFESAH